MSDFHAIQKNESGTMIPDPVVSVQESGGLGILTVAYKEMGEPTALRLHTDGERLAIEPTHRGERGGPNVFMLSINKDGHGNIMSCQLNTKKPTKLLDFERGQRYEVEHDDDTGYWIVDPNKPYTPVASDE